MKQNESDFWKKIKDNLSAVDFIERVENRAAPGWPDVHYCHGPNAGWIELKAEYKFPNRIDFEPGQPIWLERYWNAGGDCFIWLFVETENKIYIWLGKHAKALSESGGTKEVDPYMVVKVDQKGWIEIYDIFKLNPIHQL